MFVSLRPRILLAKWLLLCAVALLNISGSVRDMKLQYSVEIRVKLRHGKTKQVNRILTIATDLWNVVMNVTTAENVNNITLFKIYYV